MDSPPLTKRAGSATTGCDDIGMKNDGPGSSRFLQGWGNTSESERWVTFERGGGCSERGPPKSDAQMLTSPRLSGSIFLLSTAWLKSLTAWIVSGDRGWEILRTE